jgi:hypothetical protein
LGNAARGDGKKNNVIDTEHNFYGCNREEANQVIDSHQFHNDPQTLCTVNIFGTKALPGLLRQN